MLGQFLSHFVSVTHAKDLLTILEAFEKTVSASYYKDPTIRDEIIDGAIQHLQSLKSAK